MGDLRPKIEQRILQQLLLVLMMLALALLQTSLMPTLWRFRVDWVLIVVVGWTLLQGLMPGLRWAVYGGLALDLLGVVPLGAHLLALLLCVMIVASVTEPLDREQLVLVIAAMLGSGLIYGATIMLVLAGSGVALPWRHQLLVEIVPTAIINTIAAIPTFALLRYVHRRRRPLIEA